MRRTERALAHIWRRILVPCILAVLAGAIVMVWARIDQADDHADALKTEATRRGDAVTLLAHSVRELRQQVQSSGKTPIAPDPGDTVPHLKDRKALSLPGPVGPMGPSGLPGKAGKQGKAGDSGKAGADGSDGSDGSDGPDGADGKDGDKGDTGDRGPAGKDGSDGKEGSTGPKGDTGAKGDQGPKGEKGDPPSGWTFSYLGITYTCTPAGGGQYTCAAG